MAVYTASFRRIIGKRVDPGHSAGEFIVELGAGRLRGLSTGMYYVVFEAENEKGERAFSRPQVLLILK